MSLVSYIITIIGGRLYLKSRLKVVYLGLITVWIGISQNVRAQKSPYNEVYQYSVMVGSSRSYLWIPPSCRHVRGVIIALNNLTKRNWLEDPLIRETAAQEGLGIIWVGPPGNKSSKVLNTRMEFGSVEALTNMLRDFSNVSGYSEIAYAPIIATGHSAHGQFSWNVPNRMAQRVIATIPIKTYPLPDSLDFKDVPLCYIVGQTTEWPEYRDGRKGDRDFFWPVVQKTALHLRERSNNNLVGVVTDPGGGHFDWDHHMAKFLALYIRKACKYRLPKNEPENVRVHLKKIAPQSGWLMGTGAMQPDKYQPSPYNQYMGNPQKAYWWFDKETAEAAQKFEGDRRRRKKQMLTFIQNGNRLPVARQGFASLKFQPEKDGVTFKLKTGFLKRMPPELIGAGRKLGHAPGPIKLYVIAGPTKQIGPNTFRIHLNRGGWRAIWIEETQEGNIEYRHAVQPGKLVIPSKLTKGQPQSIYFPKIKDQKVGTKALKLNATSSSGLPVNYYVVSGPAVIIGHKLHFTSIPVKSKYPVKVTIVAYQWGHMVPPKIQSAKAIRQTFLIKK